MERLVNITNYICPYARKVNIVLREKSLEQVWKQQQVSVKDKPQLLTDSYAKAIGRDPTNNGGKVPILVDDGVYMAESEPIVWYIAEKFSQLGTNVIPQDHVERLKMRLFIEKYSRKISQHQISFIRWGNKTEEEKANIKERISIFLESLDKEITLPYALGEQFTIADILTYPHFEAWTGLGHFVGFQIDSKYKRIHEYIENLQKRQSIKQLIVPPETYIKQYAFFFRDQKDKN